MKKTLMLVMIMIAVVAASSCTRPRFITHMTHREKDNTIKFITMQQKVFGSPEWQVFKCNMAEDGRLSACAAMNLTFNYE